MRHISGFFISLLCCVSVFAQTDSTATDIAGLKVRGAVADTTKIDTVKPKFTRHGLRVGVDLFRLSRGFWDKDYRGLEIAGDYRLTRSYFLAAEIGNEDKTTDDDRVNFTTKGTYFKVGFDYNFFDNWLDMENVVSIGMRYSVSSFSQQLNSYKIYNPHNDYGEEVVVQSGQEFKGLSASWIEIVLGMKAEVIKNVFVGFSARINYMVSEKEPNNFANLYIPGFNRTYDGKFGVGFNYTVSYFIPIYKSKIKAKEKAKKK